MSVFFEPIVGAGMMLAILDENRNGNHAKVRELIKDNEPALQAMIGYVLEQRVIEVRKLINNEV
jgi:hypothetical protein